jgi:hypothetical protein
MPASPWWLIALSLAVRPAPALALDGGLGAPDAGASPDAGEPGLFQPLSGRVIAADREARRVTVEGTGGRLELGFDRNTVVYLPGRIGTMDDVRPGAEVRVSKGPEGIAYWIEVSGELPAPHGAGLPDGGTPPGGGPPSGGEKR